MYKIFEPFFTTKEKGKGTGLGLSVALGMIGNHKGHIDVKSKVDRGTTMTVYLPMNDVEEAPPAEEEAEPLKNKTILIVDDDEDFLMVTQEALEMEKYRTVKAESGRRAIEILELLNGEVNAILLNMTMPGMDGVQTFSKIREMAPNAKVIICSGYGMEEKINALLHNGASDFIQKPFGVKELTDIVESVLSPRETKD